MALSQEQDFPVGHPARHDYNPDSPEAKEWRRINVHPKGERDFAVGHRKALDTPGNSNHLAVLPGIDPDNPELEAFTGRTPEVVERMRVHNTAIAATAQESPILKPIEAPHPPEPGSIQQPAGQPGSD